MGGRDFKMFSYMLEPSKTLLNNITELERLLSYLMLLNDARLEACFEFCVSSEEWLYY